MASFHLLYARSSVLVIVEGEMQRLLCSLWREEAGQDLIEYSLFLCFVVLFCATFLGYFHSSLASIWHVSDNNIQQANVAAGGS
ncbi:MAG: hypothetical protein ABSB88_07380 [Bryobacteraceae bacterium]|jgi:Flp pilus assembly pilin Flp